MRKEIAQLVDTARSYFGVSKTASVASDFVLASALAYAIPMPSSEVDEPKVYYAEQAAARVLHTADTASRYSLVSVQRIVSLVETLWVARYKAIFQPVYFSVLFGMPLDELGDPDLARAVETGEMKTFLLKRDSYIRPAMQAVCDQMEGLQMVGEVAQDSPEG